MVTAVGYPVLVRAFRMSLTVEGLRPHTVHNYVRAAERFGEAVAIPPQEVRPTDIRSFILEMQERCAPRTVHELQLGLRRFFRFLVAEGERRTDPTSDMKLVRFRVTPQPTYSEAEVRRLIAACVASTRTGIRDRALVTVLFDTGVRVGELVSMPVPDWETGRAAVDGKTGHRTIYLGQTALAAVERYARRWPIYQGKLWQGKKGPLTESGVHQLIARLAERAGVEDKGVHAFRRAAAAQMKRLGMQDSDIMEVMGWRSISMLRRYTAAVAEELAQAAHRRFSPGDAL